MEMKAVKSSNIKAIGYDKRSKTLAVQFTNGGTYHYHGVEADKHRALLSASSIGSHLHGHIKPRYKATKV